MAAARSRTRPSLALLFLAVALGALIYHERANGRWDRVPALPPAAPPADVSLPAPLPDFELPPFADFPTTAERPLFLPDRRPPAPEQEAVEPEPAEPPATLNVVVSGVILSDARDFALVQRQGDSEILRLGKGDTIDGWSVTEVLADRVLFARESETQEVELREPMPAVRPSQADTPRKRRERGETAPSDEKSPSRGRQRRK